VLPDLDALHGGALHSMIQSTLRSLPGDIVRGTCVHVCKSIHVMQAFGRLRKPLVGCEQVAHEETYS
jgi:hypothetical protein